MLFRSRRGFKSFSFAPHIDAISSALIILFEITVNIFKRMAVKTTLVVQGAINNLFIESIIIYDMLFVTDSKYHSNIIIRKLMQIKLLNANSKASFQKLFSVLPG